MNTWVRNTLKCHHMSQYDALAVSVHFIFFLRVYSCIEALQHKKSTDILRFRQKWTLALHWNFRNIRFRSIEFKRPIMSIPDSNNFGRERALKWCIKLLERIKNGIIGTEIMVRTICLRNNTYDWPAFLLAKRIGKSSHTLSASKLASNLKPIFSFSWPKAYTM